MNQCCKNRSERAGTTACDEQATETGNAVVLGTNPTRTHPTAVLKAQVTTRPAHAATGK